MGSLHWILRSFLAQFPRKEDLAAKSSGRWKGIARATGQGGRVGALSPGACPMLSGAPGLRAAEVAASTAAAAAAVAAGGMT